MATAFNKQISNRNFLSPVGFNFNLAKYPKVSFFCNSARIPEISLSTLNQPSYLKNIDIAGGLIQYGDLSLRFLVDEDLVNYSTIHNWITGLGFPESTQDYADFITNENGIKDPLEQFSDGSLHILNSNYNSVSIIKFKDLYPTSITSLDFQATDTDINYFTAQVTFKYTVYNMLSSDGRTPL